MPQLIPRDFVLLCDGLEWRGWKSLSVSRSLDEAASTFSISTTDRLQERLSKWNVRGGSEVEIRIDGEPIFLGYAQKYSVSISDSDHSINVEGASKAIDAVECSNLGPYFWKNTTPEAIIRQVLTPFGIGVTFPDKAMKAIGKEGYRVEIEKAPFDIVRELAERDGLTVTSGLNGDIILFKGDVIGNAGFIGRGQYTSISSEHDLSQAFSQIVVKGQKNNRADSFDANQRSEVKKDNPLKVGNQNNPLPLRYRPIVYVENNTGEANDDFGEFVKSRFTGDAITASLSVKSHRNPEGDIWSPGQLVWLDEPLLSVEQFLVVSEVQFLLGDDGFAANLSLKVPSAYTPGQSKPLGPSGRSNGVFGNAEQAIWA